MRVFTDYISGDEFFSDSFPHVLLFDDACIEAKAKYITKGAETVLLATDEEEEAVDGVTVVDIQDKFALNEIQGWSKAEFMSWARGYMGKVLAKLNEVNPDRVPGFKRGATQLVKLIASNWAEMQLFCGDKMNYDGALCFAY